MSNCANLEIYEPYKKGAITSFVQSGNFEILTLTGFEPATFRVAVGHLTHYAKFPYEHFLRKFKPDFTIFLWQCRQSDQAAIGDFVNFWTPPILGTITYVTT